MDPNMQNLAIATRSITLNLKSSASRPRPCLQGGWWRRPTWWLENSPPGVKTAGPSPLMTEGDSTRASIAGVDFRFGQSWSVSDNRARLRSEYRAGHGRADVGYGLPSRARAPPASRVADTSAGLFAAIGILVALAERERSGEGQWVRSSLLQAQIAMMDFQAARFSGRGVVPQQSGKRSSIFDADGRCPHRGWLHQHRGRRAGPMEVVLRRNRASGDAGGSALCDADLRLKKPQGPQRQARRHLRGTALARLA